MSCAAQIWMLPAPTRGRQAEPTLGRADVRSGSGTCRYRQSAIVLFVNRATQAAGALLRRARVGARISQTELAARAGVTQSVVSAYESGHRQPALSTLADLIEAAGYELVVDVKRQPRRLGRLSGPVGRRGGPRPGGGGAGGAAPGGAHPAGVGRRGRGPGPPPTAAG